MTEAGGKGADREVKRAARHDVGTLHGHHVVAGSDLAEVFPDEERIEDEVRFRHRIIHGITLTILAAVMILAVIFAVLLYRGDLKLPGSDAAETRKTADVCPEATFDYPANKSVVVNVYNATRREGLAASVAAQLKKRGYKVGTVANKTTNYSGVAVVSAGPAGQAAAFNLQRNIEDTDYVQADRTGGGVDVYLTAGFSELVAPAKVDQTPGKLACPRLHPTPSAPAPATSSATARR